MAATTHEAVTCISTKLELLSCWTVRRMSSLNQWPCLFVRPCCQGACPAVTVMSETFDGLEKVVSESSVLVDMHPGRRSCPTHPNILEGGCNDCRVMALKILDNVTGRVQNNDTQAPKPVSIYVTDTHTIKADFCIEISLLG